MFFNLVRRSQAVSWAVVEWSGLEEADYALDFGWASPVMDTPYGPIGLRGKSFRKRVGLWAFQLAHLQEQCKSFRWFRVMLRVSLGSLPRVFRAYG